MDIAPIAALIDTLTVWRATEHAALQDVEDAEAHVIAQDMRLTEAKRRAGCVSARVHQIENELADLIMEQTAPPEIVLIADGHNGMV